jgi:hypothetical protein
MLFGIHYRIGARLMRTVRRPLAERVDLDNSVHAQDVPVRLQRALIGLKKYFHSYELKEIDLYGGKPGWFMLNPKGQVPGSRRGVMLLWRATYSGLTYLRKHPAGNKCTAK